MGGLGAEVKKKRDFPKLTAAQCVAALRGRYRENAFALLEQVANGTGYGTSGWADALVMSLWPSRGLTLSGFEIKVSRSDWKRELDRPEKNADIQSYCDAWWIVAPRGLIETHELPPTWGLLEVDEGLGTKVAKVAPELDAEPIDRMMLAAILRRVSESADAIAKREREAGREDGMANGAGELAKKLKRAENEYDVLSAKVEAFEKASGIDLRFEWELGKIGEAVKILRNGGSFNAADHLESDARGLERIAKRLRDDAQNLRRATEKVQAAE